MHIVQLPQKSEETGQELVGAQCDVDYLVLLCCIIASLKSLALLILMIGHDSGSVFQSLVLYMV